MIRLYINILSAHAIICYGGITGSHFVHFEPCSTSETSLLDTNYFDFWCSLLRLKFKKKKNDQSARKASRLILVLHQKMPRRLMLILLMEQLTLHFHFRVGSHFGEFFTEFFLL